MANEKDYRKLCEEYEKRLGIGEHDPAKEGYLVLVKILRQQTDFLDSFNIKSKIASEEKVDAIAYKNAKELWEKLPDMIESVSSLRITLKIDGEDKRASYKPISANSISSANLD